MPKEVRLTLPFPPSVNHYWRRNGHNYFIAAAGRKFAVAVEAVVIETYGLIREPLFPSEFVEVGIKLWPPDKRRRDADNYVKSLCDALTKARVWTDDYQMATFTVERHDKLDGGACEVVIRELVN